MGFVAIDQGADEIVGVFVGDRSQKGVQGLWDSLPLVYRPLSATRISESPTVQHSPVNAIKPPVKKVVKRIKLNALIVP